MEAFRFLKQFSAFYGNLKKTCTLVKSYCSAINGNFPIIIGIFRFLWELGENLHCCQKLIVQQYKWELSDFYRNIPLFMGIFRFLWQFEECLPYCQRLIVLQ
jgi:hypothetical protein